MCGDNGFKTLDGRDGRLAYYYSSVRVKSSSSYETKMKLNPFTKISAWRYKVLSLNTRNLGLN